MIKDISSGNGQSQAVALAGVFAPAKHSACSIAAAAASSTWTAPERSTAHRSTAGRIALHFFSKAEAFAEAQIERKAGGTLATVDGNLCLPGGRLAIEANAAANRAERFSVSKCGLKLGEGGPVGKHGIIILIHAAGDVKRYAGASYEKRAQTERVGKADSAAEEQAIANVECSPPIIQRQGVLIGGKAGYTGSVRARMVQRIVAEKRQLAAHAHAAVDDELVLLEVARSIVLIDIIVAAERTVVRIKGRQRRIDIARQERMHAARVQISKRHVCVSCQLFFQSEARLNDVRSLPISCDLIDRWRCLRRHQLRRRR